MSGWKNWQIGEVVRASDLQNFVQDQVVQVYGSSAARGSALGTFVTEGMVSYLSDTDSTEVYNGSSWIAVGAGDITSVTAGTALSGGGVSGAVTLNVNVNALTPIIPDNTNYLINGAFEINQRGFTSTTSIQYTFDRWANYVFGGTVTQSAQTFSPGAAPVAGYESRNFLRTVTTGQTASNHAAISIQRVEDVRSFANQTITVSFWAKAASGTPSIAVEAYQYFGTGGSPSAATSSPLGRVSITTSWQRYSVTGTVASISGKTIGTNNDHSVEINLWYSGGSDFDTRDSGLGLQNNTFDIWGVQAELGSAATPFKRAATTLQGELAACQRYCFSPTADTSAYTVVGTSYAVTTTTGWWIVQYPVTMRAKPTLSVSSASHFQLGFTQTANYALSAISLNNDGSNLNRGLLNYQVSSAMNNTYQVGQIYRDAGSGLTGQLIFSAEL